MRGYGVNAKDYQLWCRRFDNHSPAYQTAALALGLCAEAGEVANALERSYRYPLPAFSPKEEIALELGDVLWNVARLADELGYTLEQLFDMNINKLVKRYEEQALPLDVNSDFAG